MYWVTAVTEALVYSYSLFACCKMPYRMNQLNTSISEAVDFSFSSLQPDLKLLDSFKISYVSCNSIKQQELCGLPVRVEWVS
jgi:hypothetical protein